MKDVLLIHPSDNVAVALHPLEAGSTVDPGDGSLVSIQTDVPAGHKIAWKDFVIGEDVIKYGYPIGHTLRVISRGSLLDHRDIGTNLAGMLDYSSIRNDFSANTHPENKIPVSKQTFQGYLRPDGQAGIRNELWIVPTVGCVSGICRQIADRVRKSLPTDEEQLPIIAFDHNYGCSQLGDDHENTRRILRAMVRHPNAGGVLVVGLGCENNQPDEFRRFCGDYDTTRVRFLTCQQIEGDEVEVGAQLLSELYIQAKSQHRQQLPLSMLRIGLKCGGSDGFSGITANPLLGRFSDWLCVMGGTTVLTEVPEMFGAETILMRRAVSMEVLDKIISLINGFKEYYLSHHQPVGENPSPGNKAGGISTLEEKALGCTQKAGTSPVCGVLDYGDMLPAVPSGLYLLCAPGNDLVASTALAAAGCQLILFTTGRGTPFASFVPTMKISTNSTLFSSKPHWIDFDAGTLLEGEDMETLSSQFAEAVCSICNGKPTKAEEAGIHDIAIWKNGVTL